MSTQREPGLPRDRKNDGKVSKWTQYQAPPRVANMSWDEVSLPLIGEVVGAVTRDGAAILLGTTRDGGALVITVCDGDQRIKFYASSSEEVSSMMSRVLAAATD